MGPFIISLIAVAAGIVLAGFARLVLPVTRRLSWSTSVLVGILAGGLGAGLANLIGGGWPLRLILALAVTAGALVAAEALQTRLRPPAPELRATAELLAAGEGAHVEFKSTARRNLRTKERDERL